jgi:hypothetical protein
VHGVHTPSLKKVTAVLAQVAATAESAALANSLSSNQVEKIAAAVGDAPY